MKKVFLVVTLVLTLTLTACGGKGYESEEDVVEAFSTLYADIIMGEDVDIEKECDLIGEDVFLFYCKSSYYSEKYYTLLESEIEYDEFDFNVLEVESKELTKSEIEEYETDDWDIDYDEVFYVTAEIERVYTMDGVEESNTFNVEFLIALIDDEYKIINWG